MAAKQKQTRVITSGALVTLRARKNTSGKFESLYLDYYSNGERIYKFLKLKLYTSPKNEDEKEYNAKIKRQANEQRTFFEGEIMANNGTRPSKGNPELLLLPYMEAIKSDKKAGGDNRKLGTIKGYTTVIKLIKEKYGEGLTFADITEEWCKEIQIYFLDKFEKNTAIVYFSKIRTTIQCAIEDKILIENPLMGLNRVVRKKPHIQYLTYDELVLLKNTPCENNDLKRAALTSAMTGMRAGDLMALRWHQIKHSAERGHYIHFIQQKTEKEMYLPIKDTVMEYFGERKGPDDKIFPTFRNNTQGNYHLRMWGAIAGITKYLKFHIFRHTNAILLGEKGATLFEIKEILGHEKIETTERHYAAILDKKKKEVIDRLDDL